MRFVSCVLLALGLTVSPVMKAADQKLVSVEVTLKNDLTAAAPGIRPLFLILHDSNQTPGPPIGAVKVDLKADAKGLVYKGDINASEVRTMGRPLGNIPETFRVKARLDKDGSGGADQPGDIVGSVPEVKAGGTAKIVLDKLIP